MGRTVITNVRVFDGKALMPGLKAVVLQDSTIGSITDNVNDESANADIVDGTGCTLLPGFIDTHVHIETPDDLKACAAYGVTTVCDMACMPFSKYNELRAISRAGTAPTAWLGTNLPAYSASSRHGKLFRFNGVGDENSLSTPDQVPAFIEARKKDEVDYVKIIGDQPGLPQDVLDTIQIEASKHGLRTVVHAAHYEAFERGLRAEFDVLTHVPMDRAVDSAMADKMTLNDIVAIPTLAMMEGFKKSWILWPLYYKRDFSVALRSVTAMKEAGVMILAGTDANPFWVVDVRAGVAMHRELELLVDSGLTPSEALRAATALPAAYFKLPDRGRVETGLKADLVLVEGDPTVNISATRMIRQVWSAGVKVEPPVKNQSYCSLM
ncbi:hypothetical protein GGR57DRAFT_356251 [Xylariaceae sp. FL1272]|nr:hypothetical protein GGR57DRAFT_356251 [Xylariaceae sp. FL1272]